MKTYNTVLEFKGFTLVMSYYVVCLIELLKNKLQKHLLVKHIQQAIQLPPILYCNNILNQMTNFINIMCKRMKKESLEPHRRRFVHVKKHQFNKIYTTKYKAIFMGNKGIIQCIGNSFHRKENINRSTRWVIFTISNPSFISPTKLETRERFLKYFVDLCCSLKF